MLSTQPKAKAATTKEQAFLALGEATKIEKLGLVRLVANYYKSKRLVFYSVSFSFAATTTWNSQSQANEAAPSMCYICQQSESSMYRMARRQNALGQKVNDSNWQQLFKLVFCEQCQERLVQFFAS